MQEIHQRRKAALQYHREEFERTHSDDKVTVAAENEKLGEDEIDGTLITLQFEKDDVASVEFSCAYV